MRPATASAALARRAFLAVSEPSTSKAVLYAAPRPRLRSPRLPALYPRSFRSFASAASSPAASNANTTKTVLDSESAFEKIPEKDSFDIVIIGGANAGLALACALLATPAVKKTARILLLEGGSLDRVRTWTDDAVWENRISSLTAENVEWLRSIGVWDHIARDRSCPVEEMIIWANPSPTSSPTIHFPPLGNPMAYMTENTNLQRALLRRIDQLNTDKSFELRESSRVGEIKLGPGGRWVGLKIGDQWVRGAVIVGADGPNSPVRHFSQIDSYGHGYETDAVVATLEHDESVVYPNNTAFQRFLPTGPLAFLPLSPTASTMVWSTIPHHAAAYKRLSPEALVVMVNAGYSLPEATLASVTDAVLAADRAGTPLTATDINAVIASLPIPEMREQAVLPSTVRSIPAKSIASFPLRLSHADSYLGDRTVLVGDAAHTIHPLAGQGLNMGLADVRSLTRVWEACAQTGADLGSQTSMAGYPRERYPANQLLLTTTDTLHHVFRNRSGPINWARGLGLDVINEIAPLKKLLMGGAGANISGGQRSQLDREFGRVKLDETRRGAAGGWPGVAADGLEGWLSFKAAAGMAAGIAADAVVGAVSRFSNRGPSPR